MLPVRVLLVAALALAPSRSSLGLHVHPVTGPRRASTLWTSRRRSRIRTASTRTANDAPAPPTRTAAAGDDGPAAVRAHVTGTRPVRRPSLAGRWRKMYGALREFRNAHGHCRVPRRYGPDPPLGAWVARQRNLYAKRLRGRPARPGRSGNPLTDERIEALDALGFTWDLRDHAWGERLEELRAFRSVAGHCAVPAHHGDRTLAVWVRNQRCQYANFVGGRDSTLTPERIDALKDLGFQFGMNQTELWQLRYQELVDFRERHGHASPPELYGENPQLGSWVANQRVRYRNTQAGTKPSLSPDRVEALERIGFRWDFRSYSWSAMFERLEAYAQQHGHFCIRMDDEDNRDLRTWARVQRCHRALRERGLASPLTDDRKRKLDSIEFEWTPRRGPRRKRTEEVGPSPDDWSKLFKELEERGIDSEAKAKEHWFAGGRSFQEEEEQLKEWAEADVMELWERGDDEDDW